MKNVLIKVILVATCVLISTHAYAYDFEVDGIYYNIVSAGDKTCEVTYKNSYEYNTYSGAVSIPKTIVYNNQVLTVVGIGELAFGAQVNLTVINIPNTITYIGNSAFRACNKLTDIYIPASVQKLGTAFVKGGSLKSIVIDPQNKVYDSRDNCNAVIESATNRMILGCSTTTIPKTVITIAGSCFTSYEYFETLTIPNTIQEIEYGALGCNIKNLIIEDGDISLQIEYIHGEVLSAYIGRNLLYPSTGSTRSIFSGNTESDYKPIITSITFGPKVTVIPQYICKEAKDLKTIKILGEITEIGYYAFYGCHPIDFEFPNTNKVIKIDNFAFGKFKFPTTFNFFENFENLEELGYGAFTNSGGWNSELRLTKLLQKIDGETFKFSYNVSTLIIPQNISSVGERAFYSMPHLENLIIENANTPLIIYEDQHNSEYNFNKCPIKKVYIDRHINSFISYYSKNMDYFNKLSSLEEVIIGDNLKVLKEPFRDCENLKNLELGEHLDSLYLYLDLDLDLDSDLSNFSGCKNITKIYSKNPLPPANAIFEQLVYINAEVKVPKGSLAAYQADENWRNFWNISEMDFSGIESAVADEAEAVVDVYNLQGVCVRKGVQRSEATQDLPQGIYIIDGEKVIVK